MPQRATTEIWGRSQIDVWSVLIDPWSIWGRSADELGTEKPSFKGNKVKYVIGVNALSLGGPSAVSNIDGCVSESVGVAKGNHRMNVGLVSYSCRGSAEIISN